MSKGLGRVGTRLGSRVSILPDGSIPPAGSVPFYRFQTCGFACTEIERWNEYWLARSTGPKAS